MKLNSFKSLYIVLLVALVYIPVSFGICFSQGKTYHIGPRDILTLKIFAGGELQHHIDLTVSGDGMINVPFIGQIKAEGRTLPQLESKICKPLGKDYFVNPEINIKIKEYHNLRHYIAGAVKHPGLYEMTSETTLLELIAKAGGVTPHRGGIAYILRDSVERIDVTGNLDHLVSQPPPVKVNLKKLLDQGDMTQNMALKTGDVVYIPQEKAFNPAESKIYVEGEVKKPGVYDYQPGLTALNACIMAGGFAKFAAPNRARIIRKDKNRQAVIKIDLNEIKKGLTPDIEMKPGDLLHIPETWL